jgi:hypothetical protein
MQTATKTRQKSSFYANILTPESAKNNDPGAAVCEINARGIKQARKETVSDASEKVDKTKKVTKRSERRTAVSATADD